MTKTQETKVTGGINEHYEIFVSNNEAGQDKKIVMLERGT